MMDALRLGAFRARYRLPRNDEVTRKRLDALLREVIDDTLEPALERVGVTGREEICIRSIHSPVALKLADSDSTLRTAWGVSLAESIRRAIEAGGSGVVRYATRSHALTDLVIGVATGDFRRVWAWRQLGLWSIGDTPTTEAAAGQATRGMLAEPSAIVATVSAVARAGELSRLVAMIGAESWRELVRRALQAAEVSSAVVEAVIAGSGTVVAETGDPADGPVIPSEARNLPLRGAPDRQIARPARDDGVARRIASTSHIARAVRGLTQVDVETRLYLSALVVLEMDPHELLRAPALAAALVHEVARSATGASPSASAGARSTSTERNDPARARPWEMEPSRERFSREVEVATRVEGAAAPEGEPARAPEPELADAAAIENVEERAIDATRTSRREVGRDRQETEGAEDDDRPIPSIPPVSETEWGGLLFLLHLVLELGIPQEVAARDEFAERSLRWVLHGLAIQLLNPGESDPAALAFAGLAPDVDPPSRGEPPATEDERSAIAELASKLRDGFLTRLDPSAATAQVAKSPSVEPQISRFAGEDSRFLHRRAYIVASPGWIDVVLRLDEVSVEIRRAGLDLDPGWLPWLGVVVRFLYE